MDTFDFDTYLSPFSWRYGSESMRRVWSEKYKRRLWRRIWVALAQVQAEYGLVTEEQVQDLMAHAEDVDIQKALQVEAEIHHDLMAEIHVFARQCPVGGGIIHLGATSMDIEDNADALRIRESLDLLLREMRPLLKLLAELILQTKDMVVIGFTHLQPAEPTTLGYRLAFHAQDLWSDYEELLRLRNDVRGKGFKGAVGTTASFAELIGVENITTFEHRLSAALDLPFYPVTHQTYPRKQEYRILSAIAGLAQSMYKLAFDWRILQSPPIGEWQEPFAAKQVGSSAMPFKRNPINAEKVDALARYLAQLPRVAWDNAAHSLLERTLDDSASRRTILPEAFLAASELLQVSLRLLRGIRFDHDAMERNLRKYGAFAAVEKVLIALVEAGADRQVMHERLRQHAMQAWEALRQGQPNPLPALISRDEVIQAYLPERVLKELMDISDYIGDAGVRAGQLAEDLIARLESEGD